LGRRSLVGEGARQRVGSGGGRSERHITLTASAPFCGATTSIACWRSTVAVFAWARLAPTTATRTPLYRPEKKQHLCSPSVRTRQSEKAAATAPQPPDRVNTSSTCSANRLV
jgi:hypothetical protein